MDKRSEIDAIQERLEHHVSMVMTVRRSVDEPAQSLALYPVYLRERFIASVAAISAETVELAFNFCHFGMHPLAKLDASQWREWVQHCLRCYDNGGVIAAIGAMQKADAFIDSLRAADSSVELSKVIGRLEAFIHGLNGRRLRLAASEFVYTDTETLYLPDRLAFFGDSARNYILYKAMAVHQWAQSWYGTWRLDVFACTNTYADPDYALQLFHALETIRLNAHIARELPGLWRDMATLSDDAERPEAWWEAVAALSKSDAGVTESRAWLQHLYPLRLQTTARCYQGVLRPQETQSTLAHRLHKEKLSLQKWLADMVQGHPSPAKTPDTAPDYPSRFSKVETQSSQHGGDATVEIALDGLVLSPPAEVRQWLASIVQDLGALPEEYLVAGGHGLYAAQTHCPNDSTESPPHTGVFVYDEWDYQRKQYRKSRCVLYEKEVHPLPDDFVVSTRLKYRGLLRQLYRTFEALRGEDKIMRRQLFGDDIDIDAVVHGLAEQNAGLENDGRLFLRKRRIDRDICVVFLVDMSGSTKGWINDIERESLVLLCEALEILGDRYAVYGFSGFTHKRCEMYRIKHLDDDYDEDVHARISGIRPQDYTRLGPAIRHLTGKMHAIEARTKLLVTLTDGRPDDQDGYRGAYGIEDTRQAFFEARYAGIHPYCITIDDTALDYLPHMVGPSGFTIISQVHMLPYKVADIYRRLTFHG